MAGAMEPKLALAGFTIPVLRMFVREAPENSLKRFELPEIEHSRRPQLPHVDLADSNQLAIRHGVG